MDKLKFHFTMCASEDGKSNVLCITSITTGDISYKVPREFQIAELHTCITTTSVYANIKNSLKKRHNKRSVYIKVTEDMKKAYWDVDGNFLIGGQYPEEISTDDLNESSTIENSIADQIAKAFEVVMQKQKNNERPCLRKLSEKFVLEKYNGKGNAYEWLKAFESECMRLDIEKEEEKIEIMKVFLEKSCLDWYSAMMIKHTLQSEWEVWKENFKTTYANKGWQNSRYALSFKYQVGSLLEYALKKEKLLLEARNTADQGMLIDIIAAGLPDYIVEKINREELLETKDLFNDLGKLEPLVTKKLSRTSKNDFKPKNEEKKPCSICKTVRNKNLFHLESNCWFKSDESVSKRKNQIKNVNNSVIEAELNDTDPKNE